jgi:hypothetical protein
LENLGLTIVELDNRGSSSTYDPNTFSLNRENVRECRTILLQEAGKVVQRKIGSNKHLPITDEKLHSYIKKQVDMWKWDSFAFHGKQLLLSRNLPLSTPNVKKHSLQNKEQRLNT